DDLGSFVHVADLGDQKGSPPGRYSIGTSGINVFSHWAHSFIPRSSEGTWPKMIKAFFRPAVTASRAYSTPSHSRVSPMISASISGVSSQRMMPRRSLYPDAIAT